MSEVILVVLEHAEAAACLLSAAEHLAKRVGRGRINAFVAVALRPDEAAAVKSGVDEWTRDRPSRPRVELTNAVSPTDATLEEIGRRADFIVIGRPDSHAGRYSRGPFRTALFHTERPLLVVPTNFNRPFGHCVAIAWRDDPRTVKAVIPALRLLVAADRVHLLAGARPGAKPPGLPRVLVDHGVSAELHVMPVGPEPLGKDLLVKAHQFDADMLVMGAYAHNPLVGLILGGVTTYMLAHADIPLLLRH